MSSSANILALASATQGVSSLAQGYSQSQALKAKGDYERSMNESNARMAELQAEDAIKRGDKDATQVKKQTKKLIGSQRAAMAAQGIDIGDGSAVNVQADTAAAGAEDAMTIKNNAWREAWGFRVSALESRSRGSMAYRAARNEARSTLVTGGLNAASYGLQSYGYYKGGIEDKGRKTTESKFNRGYGR